MTEPVTITIGHSGYSDVVLAELDGAATQLGCPREEAAVLLIGAGLQGLQMNGTIKRVTPHGRGLDPTPLSDDEIQSGVQAGRMARLALAITWLKQHHDPEDECGWIAKGVRNILEGRDAYDDE